MVFGDDVLIALARLTENFKRSTYWVVLAAYAGLVLSQWGDLVSNAKLSVRIVFLGAAAGVVPVIVTTYLVLRLLHGVRHPPRNWARLDSTAGGSLRFSVNADGNIRAEEANQKGKDREVVPDGESKASMAISPDGTVIATIVGRDLRLVTVNPRSGRHEDWGPPVTVSDAAAELRVLAVAPKGDSDLWLALADGRRLWVCTISKPTSKTSAVRLLGASGTYAAFLGASLLYLWEKAVYELQTGESDSRLWRRQNYTSDEQEVLALDVAQIGGRTFVALLAGKKSVHTELIVVPADESKATTRRHISSQATHLAVVRNQLGSPENMSVLAGLGGQMKQLRPFLEPELRWWHWPARLRGWLSRRTTRALDAGRR